MKRGPFYQAQVDVGAAFFVSDGWELPAAFGSPVEELAALRKSVGLIDYTGWGVLRLRGSSRLDFVQRMSTNHVLDLTPGQGVPTVFTTPIGRIVDVAFVGVDEEDLLLLVGRGAGQLVADWLQRHVFFGDDVLVDNVTQQMGLMGVCGPAAGTVMAQLVGQEVVDLAPYHTHSCRIVGTDVVVMRSAPLGNDFLMLVQADQAPAVWAALSAAVGSFGGALVGETAWETVRISAGWPRFGRELTEDYLPLEAGLKRIISFDKGCYIGQEVIARMETFQRLAKRLVVLGFRVGEDGQAASAAPMGLSAGSKVLADGSQVGQLTSVAPLADRGMLTALAYVKTKVAQPGVELSVIAEEGELPATVAAIP